MMHVRMLIRALCVVALGAALSPSAGLAAPPQQAQTLSAGDGADTSCSDAVDSARHFCVRTREAPPRLERAGTLAAVPTGSRYTPVTIARIADTRPDSGQPTAGKTLGPGDTVNVQVSGVAGLPTSGIAAAVLNVSVIGPSADTVIRVYPAGSSTPPTSTMNASANATANNETVVALAPGGKVTVQNTKGTVDILVDVEGYFSSSGAQYESMTPTRIADTRPNSGYAGAGHMFGPQTTVNFQIGGREGVPDNAVAAVLQFTTLGATNNGFLTAYPANEPKPGWPVVRYLAGEPTTKQATVRLSDAPRGSIKLYNSTGSVNLVVDVIGYYVNSRGETFNSLAGKRIADTRDGSGKPYAGQHLAAGGSLSIDASAGGVPSGASSVVVNVTVPAGTAAGR